MSSAVAYDEVKTALLGGKRSSIKYSALSDQSEDDISGLTKSTVRRKVRETQDDEEIELKSTETKHADASAKESSIVILCEDILPGDTLQSFALRYGCSVNEIKRANGLIAEIDFYALKKLKIPVNRYSLLTVQDEKQRHREIFDQFYAGTSSSHSSTSFLTADIDPPTKAAFETTLPTTSQNHVLDTPSSSEFDSTESLEETAALLPSSPVSDKLYKTDPKNDANKYLKKLDKDIRKTVKKADLKNGRPHHNESLNEVLSSIQYYPMEPLAPPQNRGLRTNGADCGLKWWAVILCFFIFLSVIIALAVFEYYRSK